MELKDVMQLVVYWHVFVTFLCGLWSALDARYTILYRKRNNLKSKEGVISSMEESTVCLAITWAIISMVCCFLGYWYLAFTVGPIKCILPSKTEDLEDYIRSISK